MHFRSVRFDPIKKQIKELRKCILINHEHSLERKNHIIMLQAEVLSQNDRRRGDG